MKVFKVLVRQLNIASFYGILFKAKYFMEAFFWVHENLTLVSSYK